MADTSEIGETGQTSGRLYIVPTPIGNLEDITRRALSVLQGVDAILAEDTRHSRILLDHYGIRGSLRSFHEHNGRALIPGLVADLARGARLALISDAGTPGISDPGAPLIQAAVAAGIPVEVLPGPAALIPALVGSGLPCDRFVFEGFPPRKGSERKQLLAQLAREERTVVLYESPVRLAATLADLERALGAERPAVVVRELSKVFETFHRGTLAELAALFAAQPARGEIVLVIQGAPPQVPDPSQAEALLGQRLAAGLGVKEAARQVAALTGLSVSELYRQGSSLREAGVTS